VKDFRPQLSATDFFKGRTGLLLDEQQAVLDTIEYVGKMKIPSYSVSRLFVLCGYNSIRLPLALITALNSIEFESDEEITFLAESIEDDRADWDAMIGGLRGKVNAVFSVRNKGGETLKGQLGQGQWTNPSWVMVDNGCGCHPCTSRNLKRWGSLTTLGGIVIVTQASEEMEGVEIQNKYHRPVGLGKPVRNGVLRSTESWTLTVDLRQRRKVGRVRAWQRER